MLGSVQKELNHSTFKFQLTFGKFKFLHMLGCMMHSRRRFHEAWLVGNKKPGLASEALAMFRWLYEKEEQYKEKGMTPAERKEIRDREIRTLACGDEGVG